MRTETDFSGLWIPLVTPFRQGQPDHAAMRAMVRRMAGSGVSGLVVCGSTGEAAALDEQEQLALLDTTLEAAGTLPVVMGISGYHLAKTRDWIETVCRRPIAGVLLPAPHYIRPSQAGVLEWFTTLADASTAPVVIYDVPYRTGASIERQTLLELALHPNILALKDCAGDTAKTLAVLAQGRLQVLAGDDLQMFACVAQGGAGAIAASAHVATSQFVQMLALLRTGELARAQALWSRLVPWVELAFSEPNPAIIKAALALDGALDDELRPPMQRASTGVRARIAELCRSLG